MYDITIDRSAQLIETRLSGLLTIQEVASYTEELKRQFVRNMLRAYVIVIDISECPIQPQDVVLAMKAHMALMPKARAIAVVTGASLARIQARRLFTQPYTRITTDLEAGRAWVLQGVEP